jgi:hypothetical protein
MTNDTAVFDAMRRDPISGRKTWIGYMGTREAIRRDGMEADTSSLSYCPHEWINSDGYVDLKLVQQFPLMLAL